MGIFGSLFRGDHFVPQAEKIKEVLDWQDKYFGPVLKVSSK